MSYVTEYLLPDALAELQRFKSADKELIRKLREATGTPRYVLEEEDALAAPTEAAPDSLQFEQPVPVEQAMAAAVAVEDKQ